MLETKTLALVDAKALDDAPSGGFSGYASVYGGVDSYGDQIAPGAYADTLADFLRDGFVAWGHDWAMPVATPTTAVEDTRGLLIGAEFHSDPDSQRARTVTSERLARGKSMGLSIGYEAQDVEMVTLDAPIRGAYGQLTDQLRVLKRIKLFEVSLVTVPADDAARVTAAKSLRLVDELTAARAAVESVAGRVTQLVALRASEGRKRGAELSAANREVLTAIDAAIERLQEARPGLKELLARNAPTDEPAPKSGQAFDPDQLYAELLAINARLNGVAV